MPLTAPCACGRALSRHRCATCDRLLCRRCYAEHDCPHAVPSRPAGPLIVITTRAARAAGSHAARRGAPPDRRG
jgi:hypothetical protein